MTIRHTLLGACLALPLFAATGQAQPEVGRTIYLPLGAMVVILPGPGAVAGPTGVVAVPNVVVAAPAGVVTVPSGVVAAPIGAVAATNVVVAGVPQAMPMLQMIAQQQAAMQYMIAQMNAMFPPMPDPDAMLRVAFGSGPALGVSMMPLSAGHGVCSQSISIVARGDGSAPIVKTSRSGDACGAMGIGKPQGVDEVRPQAPAATPLHGPKLLEVGYPPRPVSDGTPPRT